MSKNTLISLIILAIGALVVAVVVMPSQDEGEAPQTVMDEAAAQALGRALIEGDFGLVYGGGKVGLMTVIADTVLQYKGYVTGVIPDALVTKEVAHEGLSDLRIVQSMHERKALMAELSDGDLP